MASWTAFLRGINVGGHRVRSEKLRAIIEDIGFEDVATFRASGNVVFSGPPDEEEGIGTDLEAGLESALGYAVPVMLRSEAEVRTIAAAQPFDPPLVERSEGKLQVVLLREGPSAEAVGALASAAGDDELLLAVGREIYWLPQAGVSDSPLGQEAFNRELGRATVRTKATVEALAARFLG